MKAKLLKSFTHAGKAYNPGDVFEGTEEEIHTLAQQGFIDDKKDAPIEAEAAPPSYQSQSQSTHKK